MAEALSIIGTVVSLAGPLKGLIDTISAIIHMDRDVENLIAVQISRIISLTNLLVSIERCAKDADDSDESQYHVWNDIKQAEERICGYLETLKIIVSDIAKSGPNLIRWWRMRHKQPEINNLQESIAEAQGFIALSLQLISVHQGRQRRPSDTIESRGASLCPVASNSCLSTCGPNIPRNSSRTEESLVNPREEEAISLNVPTRRESLSEMPFRMIPPESANIPSVEENAAPQAFVPALKYRRTDPYQALKLADYLPYGKKPNFKTLHLIAISPSGRLVGQLTKCEWAVLKVADGTPSLLCTGDHTGKRERPGKAPKLANLNFNQFCCAALSDEFLVVGAQGQPKILLIPIADNLTEHPVVEVAINCEALVLLTFSPNGKELLVLGRSSNSALQQAFIYSVRFLTRQRLNGSEIDPAGTLFVMKWSNPSSRSHIMAKFSNDAKHLAISTGPSRTTGKAQLRLLSKVAGEWQEMVQPLEIAIIDFGRPDTGLSADCKGVMGLGL